MQCTKMLQCTENTLYTVIQDDIVKRNRTLTTSGIRTTPQLILKQVIYPENGIRAGEDFTLQLEILVSSDSYAVNDVMAVLKLPSGVSFKGSDRSYVGMVAAGQSGTASFELTAEEDLTVKELDFSVTLSGLSAEAGQNIRTDESFTVAVEQNSDLEVVSLNVPTIVNTAYDDGSRTGQITLSNFGRADAENIAISLEGEDVSFAEGTLTIDTIGWNESVTRDFNVICESEGLHTGTITISYEDALGTPIEISQSFQLDAVYTELTMEKTIVTDTAALIQEEEKTSVWAWIFLGILGAAMVGLGLKRLILRKKRQNSEKGLNH